MSNSHWFIETLSELVDEAKKNKSKNILLGLGYTLEVFCEEAGLSEEQIQKTRELVSLDTQQEPATNLKTMS